MFNISELISVKFSNSKIIVTDHAMTSLNRQCPRRNTCTAFIERVAYLEKDILKKTILL